MVIKYRTFINGELPIINNDDRVQVYLYNKNGICDIIKADTPRYFIPAYRVAKDTVEKWANSQEHWNKTEFETTAIISTDQDILESEKFGAAVYYTSKIPKKALS